MIYMDTNIFDEEAEKNSAEEFDEKNDDYKKERHDARRIAFQALFQLDFNHGEDSDEYETLAIETAIGEEKNFNDIWREYVDSTVRNVWRLKDDLDEQISKFSTGWNINRMTAVDRNLLRLAVYEMKFAPNPLPAGIVINEMIEIAKVYGADESPKFINGVLGAFSRDGKPRESKSRKNKRS